MGDGGGSDAPHASRRLRARRPARGGSHGDAGHLPVAGPSVVVFHAQGCHLCARALEVVRTAREHVEFDLREVDITGDPELEAVYREWLPVVEIDGRRRFTYHVHPEAFRRAVGG